MVFLNKSINLILLEKIHGIERNQFGKIFRGKERRTIGKIEKNLIEKIQKMAKYFKEKWKMEDYGIKWWGIKRKTR